MTSIKNCSRLSGKVIKGSPEHRVERRRYLAQLLDEFHSSKSKEVKRQILANLANFAYDPYNYPFFLELDVTGVFIWELERTNDKRLNEFALGGLCNMSSTESMRKDIIRKDGIPKIVKHLTNTHPESVVSCITTLMFLIQPDSREKIITTDIISRMKYLMDNSSDTRIANVATIFLQDYCSQTIQF